MTENPRDQASSGTPAHYGDLSIDEYRRAIGASTSPSAPRTPRFARTAAVLVLCVACFGAGSFAPWTGRNSSDWEFEDALEILAGTPGDANLQQLSVGSIYEHVRVGLAVLAAKQDEPDAAGRDAALSLGYLLTDDLLPSILDGTEAGAAHVERHEQTLTAVRQLLQGR